MTVDLERFPHPVKSLSQSRYITYCGDLSQSKDGVLTLIKSFALIKDEFPDLQLKLIGHNKDLSYINSLKESILNRGLSNSVIFTGFIHPENIPNELYKSRLLVLSRPDNIQAQGGFPTKLGEYLATGVPVVVTSVGELPYFLKNDKNAFLGEPDNVESFAEAMRRALSDNHFALKVGLAGRETALKYFSHLVQGKFISDFLSENKLN